MQGLQSLYAALIFGVVMLGRRGEVSAMLSTQYYANTCPIVEQIVMNTISALSITDPTTPPALLRLIFHDCQVQGCDASIMLDSERGMTSELVSDKNFGIRKLNAIDRLKSAVETACPGTVSCADLIALAGRDAIRIAGGPTIPIPLGRRDSPTASNAFADQLLPPATISVDAMLQLFGRKGMNVEEAVAMLGAHTIGVGHCVNVVKRLYPQSDANLGLMYASFLRINCPTSVPLTNLTFIANDMTNLRFDNQYYRDLTNGRGLFSIDSAIATHPRTARAVLNFASDENYFFQIFSQAFIKLTTFGVLTGNQGQIRNNCHFVN
ncbi:hypothetical protein SUGI_0836100 [Cryptomeria japonica]|uniref:peroxidase 29 n=1 Tax=Cryptomeria japonica TaxID=3369 RepID=UPI002414AD7B|nr:peroxidase 29 [Cryptomeria japonica]GLJ40533.1 hypothetical protein SUGI_0836100 [Cryptomeria japonica]